MCEHTCRQFCHNGAKLDTDTCKCQCDTERETGNDCRCRAAFTGQNCKSCAPTVCNNGGVFNSTTCKCDCPLNCGGRDCSLNCKDTVKQCDWPVYMSLKCGTTDSFDEDCRRACGFCTYDSLYRNGTCTAH
ncbi:hypothetical protein V1264_007907 [Littorina saxatilis]|uniref:Uncharacterized protein n=2 Tax=Littorina saxatilis TaxID=31220 RepID=A0AAN9G3M8_9CAEN